MNEIPQHEKDARYVWRIICMMEYQITGDMIKATACANELTRTLGHAHAEKIRASEPRVTPRGFLSGAHAAADLIDPEVS